MKTHVEVSSSRRKSRKAHFAAPSHIKYRLMAARLSKELRTKHSVNSMPIRKDDEVLIMRGTFKGNKGKVKEVYRKKWAIHIEKITKTKINGAPYDIQIHPSNVCITKIKLFRDR